MGVHEGGFLFVEVEVRRGQVQVQQVLPPGQVQGRGDGGLAFTLFEDVGDVFAAVGLEGEGVVQGAGGFVRAVDLAQGDDFLDVVRGVEALFLQLARVEVGLGSQAQEGLQEGLLAGALAIDQQFLDMIGVADVLAAVVTSARWVAMSFSL